MIANNVQSVMDPICYILNNRLDIIETVLRDDGDDDDEAGHMAGSGPRKCYRWL